MSRQNTQILLAKRPSGLPDAACWETRVCPAPVPRSGEALVETVLLSIDPAMRGWMNDVRSYVPPVGLGEVMRAYGVGRVVDPGDTELAAGAMVVGMLGWQECAALPAAGLQPLPEIANVPLAAWLGVLGYPGLTAFFGLFDIGQAKPGDVVLVSAASGAVGSVAAQLAKLHGCTVVGTAGGSAKCAHLIDTLGLDGAIDYTSEARLDRAVRAACPEGIDVYFDNVGGPLLDAAMRCLRRGARVVICGAIHDYNATEVPRGPGSYLSLLVNRARMEGFVVFDYAARYQEAQTVLAGHLVAGRLHHEVTEVSGLAAAPDALLRLFSGDKLGKLVVRVGA